MKICKFTYHNETKFGAIKDNLIFPIADLNDFRDSELMTLSDSINIEEVQFIPLFTPTKIVCVGRNYAAHAKELGNEVPTAPLLFLKAPSALILDGENIVIPEQSNQVEHEGELAVVIGRKCRNLSENDNPFEYVFGYTCLNDVTARDIQRNDVQFTRGKSFDTFCPLASFVETDLDVSDVRVTTKVNGVTKQDGRTSQMVFPIDFLIRYISNQMTLNAGDIIATGTPAGVSKMNEGDICEVEIEGVGILRNPITK
jgi:2-keto-4-pentenoate hydratase/2-oxohepta-3-ene-1,7-dioic acid hydratase in catechol pathway